MDTHAPVVTYDVFSFQDDKTTYARLRFEWTASHPGSPERLEILDKLKSQTRSLSKACGFPAGNLAEYASWTLPDTNAIR